MTKIVRVGVTFPPELLKNLDETIEEMGYESRSKAIQDAVSSFITDQRLLHEQKGRKAGVLVMVYDHDVKGLEDDLIESQHHHRDVINSVLHVHLSDRECLEAVAVKGEAEDIRKLAQELATRKGVKQVRSTIVSS
ncbi:nickel-responsive transcriptional regulator NikR [Candidatus Bathyarchaeota archaeon]|nr:nickel-responsive transcriptional regulator NikR [Candidatus Bathyarchaeota archaeon]